MPVISMFYGVIVMMYYFDNRRRHEPHIHVKYGDGAEKRFDVNPYLDFPVFRQLKNLDYFKNIRIVFGTVQWQNEQDISPETLYLESEEVSEKGFYESSNRNEIEQLGR